MKKAAAFIASVLIATGAYAQCRTHTITGNGQMVTCTTCCYYGNCNTTCF